MTVRVLPIATLAAAVVALGTVGANAAPLSSPLYGPDGSGFCDGLMPDHGADNGYGTARISYKASSATVWVSLRIRALQPNTEYSLLLIQGVHDCYTDDTYFTTSDRGTANVRYSEPRTGNTALVFVVGGIGTYMSQGLALPAP